VVEDERHIARFLEFILRKEGYQVTVAADGEQALASLDRAKPDAMLLDLVLPGMSGLDVLRRLRSDRRNSDLVVLVLTARAFEDTPEEVIQAGADSHCTKPIAPSTLLRRLMDFGVPPRFAESSRPMVRICNQPAFTM
jgi:two-component system phosphate regulon response regulator PhoB